MNGFVCSKIELERFLPPFFSVDFNELYNLKLFSFKCPDSFLHAIYKVAEDAGMAGLRLEFKKLLFDLCLNNIVL